MFQKRHFLSVLTVFHEGTNVQTASRSDYDYREPGIGNQTFGNRTQSNSIGIGLCSIEFGNRTQSVRLGSEMELNRPNVVFCGLTAGSVTVRKLW